MTSALQTVGIFIVASRCEGATIALALGEKEEQRPGRGSPKDGSRAALLHEPSAQSCKFSVADRPCLFQPAELFDFVCDAETGYAPEFIARLPSLLHVTLRHASSLKDQVCKHDNEWKCYPSNHPCCLDPTRDVVATE